MARHVAIATVVGVVLIAISQAYQPALLEWAASDPARMRGRAQMLIAIVAVILLAPLAGFASYIWRLASRTLAEERFPPEGLAVIHDVLVLRGDVARARGRQLRGLAVALCAIIALLALVLYRLATLPPGA
jgi:hypothetical protein